MLDIAWTIIFLGVCSITDIKERKINTRFCIINILIMNLLHIFSGKFSWWNVAGGVMIGGIFFIINRTSKDGIGMGDVFMISAIACVCGVIKVIEILFWSCVICAIFSIIGIVIGKINIKSKIPFAPFMLVGNIIFWTCERLCDFI